jgi:hypothetical protein
MGKDRAATFAVALCTLLVGRNLGDHITQTDHQAAHKATSWRAMAGHVVGYTATCAALLAAVQAATGQRPSWRRVLAAHAFSAATHALLDRRWPVAWVLRKTRSPRFAELQAPINGPYVADLLCTKVRCQRFMTWSTRGCKPAPRVAVTAEPNCVELIGIAAPSGPELTKRLGDRGAGVRQRFRCGQTQRTKDHLAAVPHLRGLCPCTAEVVSLDIGHGTLRRGSCQRAAEASGRLPEPVEFGSPSDRDRAEERVRHGQQPQALAKGHDARLRHGPGQLAKHGFAPNDCFQAIHVPILVEPQVARQTQPARSGGAR